jgi:hypothetical protein
MRRAVASLAASLVWFVLLSSAARAHEGHNDSGSSDILPLVVLGAGLHIDRREDVGALYSDIGVFVGVGGLLLSIGLFLF